jgi:hypothetical protein
VEVEELARGLVLVRKMWHSFVEASPGEEMEEAQR